MDVEKIERLLEEQRLIESRRGKSGSTNFDFNAPGEAERIQRELDDAMKRDQLATELGKMAQDWRMKRVSQESMWEQEYMAFRGPKQESATSDLAVNASRVKDVKDPLRSNVYFHISQAKVRSAFSRLVEILFQGGDKLWGIKPTPEPDLPINTLSEVGTRISQETGMVATDEQVEKVARVLSDDRAHRMEKVIDDQLTECLFEDNVKRACYELVLYGSCAVKVETKKRRKSAWTKSFETDEFGNELGETWVNEMKEEMVPSARFVSIMDLYPDPYALTCEEAEGFFELHKMSRSKLIALGDNEGFSLETIMDYIKTMPEGDMTQKSFNTIRTDSNPTPGDTDSNRYEVWEYHGKVRGEALSNAGVELEEDQMHKDFNAIVWFVEGRTIFVELDDMEPEMPVYRICPYQLNPRSIWGTGVVRSTIGTEAFINYLLQKMADNISVSATPSYEVDAPNMTDGDKITEIEGNKVYARIDGDNENPLIRVIQVPSLARELLAAIDKFKTFSDEESLMPSYTYGQQGPGLNKTASGMSMMMSAALIALKPVIKNLDSYITEPVIRWMYNWNMNYHEDNTIKGDMGVKALGATIVSTREAEIHNIINFSGIVANRPESMRNVDMDYLDKETAKRLGLDPEKVVPGLVTDPLEEDPMPQSVQEEVPVNENVGRSQRPLDVHLGGVEQQSPVGSNTELP